MENGPFIFLGVAGGIVIMTLIVGRLFRSTINKPMPGDDPRSHETHWYGGGDNG